MHKTVVLIAMSWVLLFGASMVPAQGSLTVETPVGCVWYDTGQPTINPGTVVSLPIRLYNNTSQSIRGFSNGFWVYTRNGQLTDNLYVDWARILPGGLPSYVDGGVFANLLGDDHDTVGFSGFTMFGQGIPDGFNELVFEIGIFIYPFAGSGDYEYLCIDSTWFPPGGAWMWSSSTANFHPDWNGPRCWKIGICPCGPWAFSDTGTAMSFVPTELATHTFEAHNQLDPDAPTYFRLMAGPGSIADAGGHSVTWTWQPTQVNVGHTYTVTVLASGLGGPAQKSILVYIGNPLGFTKPCGEPIVVAQGDTAIADVGIPPNEFTGFIADDGGAPGGGCYIDGNGLLHFESNLNCRGVYYVQVGLTNSVDSIFCTVPVLVTDETCLLRGNVDGDMTGGGAINIADLTWLVDYLFTGGLRPTCLEEGNVDGIGDVNVSDLTFLVAYLFQGGATPPPCS